MRSCCCNEIVGKIIRMGVAGQVMGLGPERRPLPPYTV